MGQGLGSAEQLVVAVSFGLGIIVVRFPFCQVTFSLGGKFLLTTLPLRTIWGAELIWTHGSGGQSAWARG
jgi:hypothetical protein